MYCKDWHIAKDYPESHVYETPVIFQDDWLNSFWDSKASSEPPGEGAEVRNLVAQFAKFTHWNDPKNASFSSRPPSRQPQKRTIIDSATLDQRARGLPFTWMFTGLTAGQPMFAGRSGGSCSLLASWSSSQILRGSWCLT